MSTHKKSLRTGVFVGTLAALLAGGTITGAQTQRGRPATEETTTRGVSRNLRATLSTERGQYGPNQAVSIRMTLTNIGGNRIRVENVSEYDITIRQGRGGRTVWRSRPPRRETFRIEPGQTRSYRELWDQRGEDGRRVPPGVYTIEARISPQNPVTTQIALSDRDDQGRPGGGRPGWDGGDIPRPRPPYEEERGNLQADVRLDRASVRAGDTVNVTYIIRNTGPHPRTFRFSSGRDFDVIARSERSRRAVWQLSGDRMYTQALRQWTLEPGRERRFTASWRTDRDLPSDSYEITAFLATRGDRDGTVEARTRVRVTGRANQDRDGRDDHRGWDDRPRLPRGLDDHDRMGNRSDGREDHRL